MTEPIKRINKVTIKNVMVCFETKSGRKAMVHKFAFIEMVKGPMTQSILEEWWDDAEEDRADDR